MRSLVTVSNALVSAIVDGAPLSADDKRQMLERSGLVEPVIRDITGRSSIVKLARLWRHLLRMTGDEFVGLTIGTAVRADRFGVGVKAAHHSTDFRSALVQFVKYASLINDLLECKLEEDADTARLVARLHWDVFGLERHAVDIIFAALPRFARERLGADLVVREVRVKHGLRSAKYDDMFRAPVTYSAPRYEIVFEAHLLGAPMVNRDSQLALLLDKFAKQELDKNPIVTDLPARIVQILRASMVERTDVDIEALATQLETTTRSLQRRLQEHSTSYSMLLDEARRGLAPELLDDPAANVEQVCFQLGYSEPTAFIRAFKKWYGMTPGTFRKRHGGS